MTYKEIFEAALSSDPTAEEIVKGLKDCLAADKGYDQTEVGELKRAYINATRNNTYVDAVNAVIQEWGCIEFPRTKYPLFARYDKEKDEEEMWLEEKTLIDEDKEYVFHNVVSYIKGLEGVPDIILINKRPVVTFTADKKHPLYELKLTRIAFAFAMKELQILLFTFYDPDEKKMRAFSITHKDQKIMMLPPETTSAAYSKVSDTADDIKYIFM